VKLRLSRLNQSTANLQFAGETNTEKICTAIRTTNPIFAIIDSIQTLRSDESNSTAGSLPQVSISCAKLIETAKQKNIPIFIIGHITKQGLVAGPKTLEHLVDTVLYLEGDKNHFYRLLRCVKNRFGSIDEIGVFEMTEKGLIDVPNPSSVFLQNFDATASGTVATVIMEGTRPFSVEIQALTTKTYFGYPKRTASGFKESRLELIIAVLSKRLNLKLSEQDVYLNVAGGLKITEPAADLAVALAIISSYKNQPLDQRLCAFGEIGLAGEIRPVPLIDRRLREAENLGFLKAICPPVKFKPKDKLQITEIKNITEHT
jgi:DNA repair protein RadA/Sms